MKEEKRNIPKKAAAVCLAVLLILAGIISAVRTVLACAVIRDINSSLSAAMWIIIDWLVFALASALMLATALVLDLYLRSLGLIWIIPAALSVLLTAAEWALMAWGCMDSPMFGLIYLIINLAAFNFSSAAAVYCHEKRRRAVKAMKAAEAVEAPAESN